MLSTYMYCKMQIISHINNLNEKVYVRNTAS